MLSVRDSTWGSRQQHKRSPEIAAMCAIVDLIAGDPHYDASNSSINQGGGKRLGIPDTAQNEAGQASGGRCVARV
jgi:hypothetical protein